MSRTWNGVMPPAPRALALRDWLRVTGRGGAILGLMALGLPFLLILRLPERLIYGTHRPSTPHITQAVCRLSCRVLGLRPELRGAPMTGPGVFVANHVGWLDILVLNAATRVVFVAKAEVAGWPGIGWLARATGTVFVARDPRAAAAQTRLIEDRVRAGDRLLFFPEGTSSDGRRVLPFRSTLFQAFLAEGLRNGLLVQPVSMVYRAPSGADPAFYGWWGDMALAPSLLSVLAQPRQGGVRVICHAPLFASDFADRKALAAAAEAVVRQGFEAASAD